MIHLRTPRADRLVRPAVTAASLLALSCFCAAVHAQEAAPASPPPATHIDTGDTAWLLVSAALVLFMTPGLALFYGGMVRTKNVLNVLMQSFVAIAVISILWVLCGYSLAFAPGTPFLGTLQWAGLNGVGQTPHGFYATTVPHQVFMVYQMMFAVITPALISGAIAERMKFSAYVVFIVLWGLIVYPPLAHMVWGQGGYLATLGALDFAGGTVVHISSGISALVLAILLGKRKLGQGDDTRPHNLPMTLIGTGLLWFGWFGFNAGSALASGGLAGTAFVTTHVAAAAAALSWTLIEWVTIKKPTALGFASGAVAGLVAITPAAGFVNPMGALVIGLIVSFLSYTAIRLKKRFGYDDTLDVFGVHCIGGIWGALATGLFADPTVNAAVLSPDAAHTVRGLLLGGGFGLVGKQALGVLVALAMGAIGTLVIGGIIRAVIGLRVRDDEEEVGLDQSLHDEEGYAALPSSVGPHSIGFRSGFVPVHHITGAGPAVPRSTTPSP